VVATCKPVIDFRKERKRVASAGGEPSLSISGEGSSADAAHAVDVGSEFASIGAFDPQLAGVLLSGLIAGTRYEARLRYQQRSTGCQGEFSGVSTATLERSVPSSAAATDAESESDDGTDTEAAAAVNTPRAAVLPPAGHAAAARAGSDSTAAARDSSGGRGSNAVKDGDGGDGGDGGDEPDTETAQAPTPVQPNPTRTRKQRVDEEVPFHERPVVLAGICVVVTVAALFLF
jgi:hypothetical protein